jgi:hypothetical protein
MAPPARRALEEGTKPMSRRKKIYEGKAKILFEGPEPGVPAKAEARAEGVLGVVVDVRW